MCRTELVPENKDREEAVQLRTLRLRDAVVRDSLGQEVTRLRELLDSFGQEVREVLVDVNVSIDMLCKRIDNEPVVIHEAYRSHEPCDVCGCSSECDMFGDRTCFCDSCRSNGCVDSHGIPFPFYNHGLPPNPLRKLSLHRTYRGEM